jgi:hypothetical protein
MIVLLCKYQVRGGIAASCFFYHISVLILFTDVPTFTAVIKTLNMKRIFFTIVIATLFAACNTGASDTPKGVVNAFFEAAKKGDIEGIKKYITSSDLSMLEMGQRMMSSFDSSKKGDVFKQLSEEFSKQTKDVKFDLGNEKIDGDNATVDVTVTENGKAPETHPFTLKKESGQWKISLSSTGMKESGMSQQEIDGNMQKIHDEMKKLNTEGIKDTIQKAMEELKKINPDSLKKLMKEGDKQLQELKKIAEQAGH